MHSGCIDKDHQCYTWGSSTYGQLGLTKETIGLSEVVCSPTLLKISSSDDDSSDFGCDQPFLAKKISCGGMHTGAISTTGDVYCWGRADSGQTGYALWYRNFFPGVLIPRKVMGLDNTAVNISCGGFHTLILTSTGRVYAMGKDDFGMLGVEDTHHTSMAIGVESPTLVTFFNDQSIMSVNAGGWHSCFLTSTGKLYSCGKGEYGRLGVGAEKSFTNPEEVKIDGNVDDCINSVSCGGSHTIFSTTNGKLYTVGRADNGRLGIGETKERMFTTPVDITSSIMTDLEYNIVRVSTGGTHSTVLIDYPNMTDSDYDKAFAK